jgi:mRNA interferase MazF
MGWPMKRGDIYFANLDPTIGSETKKTRPVLIVSNNAANKTSTVITVIPLSSQIARVFPFEVLLKATQTGLTKDSKAMAQQIRTLDRQRLGARRSGLVDAQQMVTVDAALRLHLGL